MHVKRRGAPVVVGVAIMMALLGGCAGRDVAESAVDVAQLGAVQDIPPRVTVSPADGAVGVSPTEQVTVAVAGGQITVVRLAGVGGTLLAGALSPDGERWVSTDALRPNTAYSLAVSSRSAWGKDTTSTTRFSTLAPGQRVSATVTPDGGRAVQVDQPISVRFDKAVDDREVVERALQVTANPPVNGTTEWRSDRELLWRPDPAWPAGSRVTVSLDIFGKRLGEGMFGAADLRSTFTVAGGSASALSSASRPLSSRPATPSSATRSGSSPAGVSRGATESSGSPSSAARAPRSSGTARASGASTVPSPSSSSGSNASVSGSTSEP